VLNANRCCVEAADTLDGDMQATPEFDTLWCVMYCSNTIH